MDAGTRISILNILNAKNHGILEDVQSEDVTSDFVRDMNGETDSEKK